MNVVRKCFYNKRSNVANVGWKKFDSFTEKINKSGGKILKTESWGLRSLAYKIKKNSKGYYYLINSDCDSKILNELNTLVKQDDDFLKIF